LLDLSCAFALFCRRRARYCPTLTPTRPAATATLPPTAAAKTAEPERNITPAKEIEAAEQVQALLH